VNCFEEDAAEEEEQEQAVAFHPYREEEAASQISRLRRVRAERDGAAVAAALARLERDAREDRNVMPAALDAVSAYATVGEVCGVFKKVFGTYQEPVRF